jgi:tetratricopeptide (TPR) repeat protein
MTLDKARLDSWFNEAYTWLRAFDEINIRPPIRLLVERMEKAIDRKDYNEAWFFLDQLKDLTDMIRGVLSTECREQSIIRIECAVAAYRMGNLPEALKLLQKSLELYDRNYGRHYEATMQWMLGCVQWQTPDQRNHAILSWEGSIEMFRDLVDRSLDIMNITRSTWYSNRIVEMNSAFELALQPSEAAQSSPPDQSKSPEPSVRAQTSEMMYASMPDGDFLRLFRVSNEVAAGDFNPSGLNSESLGFVEINQFHIDGRAHYLVNMRKSGKVIKTVPGKQYEVVRVSGESMTAEGIDDGDYVLLRIQDTAEHNDIVAAQIHSIDSQATLKKFLIERNKFILRFRSNNKMYKHTDGQDMEFHFSGYNHEKFEIVGVAIAVFKPLHVPS